MKQYGQHNDYQTTILDACILKSFKDEYTEQCNVLYEMQNNNALSSAYKDEKIFNNFNLAKGNQLFTLKGSNLFNQSTLLFHDIYNIDKESILLKIVNTPIESTTKQSTTNLFAKAHSFNNNKESNENFFNVTELSETMSYFDAIKFAYEMQKTSNGLLYGIILKRNNVFINPLHPIIAQSLTKKHENKFDNAEYKALLNNQYNVFIYTYNEDSINNNSFKFYNDALKNTFNNHIINVLSMLEQTFESSSTIVLIEDIRNNKSAVDKLIYSAYTYSELSYLYKEKFEDEENNYNVNIEPVQIVNNGLIYPYYGIVAQKYSMYTRMKGYQLSPMLSPNVGNFNGSIKIDDNDNEIYSVSGRGICTGHLNSYSENGWRSLNHANLNSPYFVDILSIGSFTFSKLCVDISLNIYAKFLGLELLDIDMKQKTIPISFATFKKNGLGTLFKEYIEYCKQQGNEL